MKPKVSVIISTRNDTAMLAVTVRSVIEELRPLGRGQGEIVIVDNSDPFIQEQIKSIIPSRYISDGVIQLHFQSYPCLFTARETAAEKSKGEFILCLDSHMVIGRDMILDLVRSISERSSDPSVGFIHSPINWAHQHESKSKHDRDMSVNELGDWNAFYPTERTISWKGMPWICRRNWFLDRDQGLNAYGALSEHRLSWGGGDMHIGIKPWLLGFKNWSIPSNPAIHIGPFPYEKLNPDTVSVDRYTKDKYRLWTTSGEGPGCFGFLVSCYVLGGEDMMKRNKQAITDRFGRYLKVEKYWELAKKAGQSERDWLLQRQVMTFDELLERKPWNN
jgi:glycosyltransferase involved in cell wall biosynthesis